MGPTCGAHAAGPRQSRALHPEYVGCVHEWPPSKEKYTPEEPTPGVNGHVVGSPALHASMSISSLAPATTSDGLCASIATAGSFCLFCENGDDGLPTVTSVPVAGPAGAGLAIAAPAPVSTTTNTAAAAANFGVRIGPPCRKQAKRNATPGPAGPSLSRQPSRAGRPRMLAACGESAGQRPARDS